MNVMMVIPFQEMAEMLIEISNPDGIANMELGIGMMNVGIGIIILLSLVRQSITIQLSQLPSMYRYLCPLHG